MLYVVSKEGQNAATQQTFKLEVKLNLPQELPTEPRQTQMEIVRL